MPGGTGLRIGALGRDPANARRRVQAVAALRREGAQNVETRADCVLAEAPAGGLGWLWWLRRPAGAEQRNGYIVVPMFTGRRERTRAEVVVLCVYALAQLLLAAAVLSARV